ncbi:MAG: protein kinase [Acidobacteria bacterium]|nr:protein kinase [Acidobacteriota bacterium]MCB9398364.1 protein kinase [Acidobacteriota bacterium]
MEFIGKYKIEGDLGRGGMGHVYAAFDPVIERKVAIKVFLDEILEDKEMKARFYQEARSAGKLSHPNITVVHDIGEIDGKPFIVMEYLTGTDLKAIIEEKVALDLEDKCQIAIKLAEGLFFAHQHRIVHRDVKPENVRILDDGRVKIMDFGIAKPEASNLTQTGTMMGTPSYMSPEQIRGHKVDFRSDIFSFGVVLQELLSHKRPFYGKSTTALIYKITSVEADPLVMEEKEFQPLFQGIIEKCLKKEPIDRYTSMQEVIDELTKALNQVREEHQKEGAVLSDMDSQSIDKLLMDGKKLFARNKYQMAKKVFDHILKREPDNAEINQLLTKVTSKLNLNEQVDTLIKRANHFLEENNYENAIASLNQALGLDPSNALAKAKMKQLESKLADLATMATQVRKNPWVKILMAAMLATILVLGWYLVTHWKQPEPGPEPAPMTTQNQPAVEAATPEETSPVQAPTESSETTPPVETAANGQTPKEEPQIEPPTNALPAPKPKPITDTPAPKENLTKPGPSAELIAARESANRARAALDPNEVAKAHHQGLREADNQRQLAQEKEAQGAFEAAQNLYEQARDIYERTRQEVKSQLRLTVGLAKTESVAQFKNRPLATGPAFERAQSLAQQAETAANNEQWLKALDLYEQSARELSRAEDRPSAAQPVDFSQKLRTFRDTYQRLFQNKQVDALKKHVGMSQEEAAGWSDFFGNVEEIQLVVEDEETKEEGNQLVVQMKFTLSYLNRSQHKKESRQLPVTWRFEKKGDDLQFVSNH